MKLPNDIIIVEDEVITQIYLKNIFAQYNIEVQACFDNAKDVLKSLKNLNCTMILMDINIKGSMDGILLAQEILYHCDIPIVFITAHNDKETISEILELTHYGIIIKPFSSRDVIKVLENAYRLYEKNHNEEPKEESVNKIFINNSLFYIYKSKELLYNSKNIKINTNQYKLLEILLKYKNSVVKYDVLIYEIWGENEISSSSLRTLVYSLRKLDINLPIISHSKVGYAINIDIPN